MKYISLKIPLIILGYSISIVSQAPIQESKKLPQLLLVMGSVRNERTSEKIAHAVYDLLDTSKLSAKIIDLKAYSIPVIDFETTMPNDKRTESWSKVVTAADALIFLVPNYNEGYSGVLKNAIDALTYQWKDKIVCMIAYSGGYDGGKLPAESLAPVLQSLHMKLLPESTVYIPFCASVVDLAGAFKKQKTKDAIETLLNNLMKNIIN